MKKEQCRVCSKFKIRVRAERQETDGGRWVYRDEKGSRWNRRVCPGCFKGYMAQRRKKYKKTVHSVREANSAHYVAPATKMRSCRDCGASTHNYFRCTGCISKLRHTTAWEASYHSADGVVYG